MEKSDLTHLKQIEPNIEKLKFLVLMFNPTLHGLNVISSKIIFFHLSWKQFQKTLVQKPALNQHINSLKSLNTHAITIAIDELIVYTNGPKVIT